MERWGKCDVIGEVRWLHHIFGDVGSRTTSNKRYFEKTAGMQNRVYSSMPAYTD